MKCPTCGNNNLEDAQFCGGCGTALSVSTASGVGIGPAELPMVSFPQAIKLGFKNYSNFSGRARRSEYWWFLLFSWLLGFIPLVGIVGSIVGLAVLVSIATRRLHDIGKSGWWLLIPGIPVIAAIISGIVLVALIFSDPPGIIIILLLVPAVAAIATSIILFIWFVRKGDTGPNKYGPDPRHAIPQ